MAVSRFSDTTTRDWLESKGVRTISCDLLDRDAWPSLPDAKDVIYLVGLKFGTSERPWLTWAVNTLVPAHAAERYSHSRMVALSTGGVYDLVAVEKGGSVETDPVRPVGEYGNAALARSAIVTARRAFGPPPHQFPGRVVDVAMPEPQTLGERRPA